MSRQMSRGGVVALTIVLLTTLAPPASAQFDDLPIAPAGALGPILSPLETLLEQITEPLGDALGDVPLTNAVRLRAEDAVDASIALSQITFPTSNLALIGRDDVFADTLSSVSAQGIAGAPLLLTQTDALDPRIQEELTRLGVTRIIILGSTGAISPGLEATFVEMYGEANVTRVGGPSRVETAALLADAVAPAATDAVLLRAYPDAGNDQSQAYADALSVGPYASINEFPALLTTTSYLHPAAEAYLESSPIERVTIVGGEAAVGPEVEAALVDMGITVTRINGQNRWDTSILIAKAMGMMDAADANRLILSEGGAIEDPLWAAGFAAAAQGAVFESPVILADGALLPPETLAFLGDGLISNALRLSNLPLICNSFVTFLACQTVALLLLGPLDEVNALTGGALETVLGPAFGPLAEALDGAIPGPGGMEPGLIGQILSIIGVPGTEQDTTTDLCNDGIDNDGDGQIDEPDECEAAFAAAMSRQPPAFQAAVLSMVGPEGQRISPTRQIALSAVLADLQAALPGPVDLTDPAAAEALSSIFDTISTTLGSRANEAPLDALNDILVDVEQLIGDLVRLAAIAGLVSDLGVGSTPQVEEVTGLVSGLLTADSTFAALDQTLVERYGPAASELQTTVNRLASRG